MTLYNQLSKIVIGAVPGEGLTENILHGISIMINGIYNKIEFNLFDECFYPCNSKGSIMMATSADGSKSEAIVLPDSSQEFDIIVTLANKRVYMGNLKNSGFRAGATYYYILTVNETGIEINLISTAFWDGAEYCPNKKPISFDYKVGDFYPNPSNPETAEGVVYWLQHGSDGKSGKILSLDTTDRVWSENNAQSVIKTSIVDGYFNTRISLASDPTLKQFPAFEWCFDKGAGWYLPARYELHVLCEQWRGNKSINNSLSMMGGRKLSLSDCYLSSTESRSKPASNAESYNFFDMGWTSYDKREIGRVRAIKTF